MRYLTLIGSRVTSGFKGAFFWGRVLWYLLPLAFAVILLIDLFRIPVPINRSHELAPEQTLWEQKNWNDPAVIKEQKKLEELQARCDHPTENHYGHRNYYCPICRKKLLKEKPPLYKL